MLFFFFNDTATTEIYTLSLHDALPILPLIKERILVIILLLHFLSLMLGSVLVLMLPLLVWLTPDLRKHQHQDRKSGSAGMPRPISYAVFCLKKKKKLRPQRSLEWHRCT